MMATEDAPHPHNAVDAYLEVLASAAPTPGGGSAAAMIGAVAAALVAMVARLTVGKAAFAEVEGNALRIVEAADAYQKALVAEMAADEAAFRGVMAAVRLPRDGDLARENRRASIAAAMRNATEPPFATARLARDVLNLALEAARIGNPTVKSDAVVAGWAAHAAIRASAVMVRINLQGVRDAEFAADCETELSALTEESLNMAQLIEQSIVRP
jgi:formiminotetrahydrofolate cyclodeaminase